MRPKIERYFLESFFLERNFWSSITARTTLFPSMSVEWIHFPRIRTFVQTFSRPLFQKEAFEIWGVPSFPRREHVLAVISLRLGNQQLSIHIKTLLDDLKSSKNYCPRKLFSGSNSSSEKSLQKNRSIFCLKNWSCDRRKTTTMLTTNGLMCSKCVSQKRNEAIDNSQWFKTLLYFIL